MSFHKNMSGDDLHKSKLDLAAGSPIGVITPEFIGQPYIDQTNKLIYVSTGLNNTDWEGVGGSGGLPSFQNIYGGNPSPRILTTEELSAIILQNGGNLDTNNVLEVKNIVGSTTFSVDGSGIIKSLNNIVLPKASGKGMMIDNVSPTFGWRDLTGDVVTDFAGVDAPTLTVFRGGSVREYLYGTGDKADMRFHIPHDYVPNSDIFLHIHWGHNGTAISGDVIFTFTYTYAKGHQQEVFFAEKTITIPYSTVNVATTPRWQHNITEVQLSAASPTVNQMLSSLLEVDGLLLFNMTVTALPTITGGNAGVFINFIDLHYQSTNMPTKQKSPSFYV